jgi:hypothetical protein
MENLEGAAAVEAMASPPVIKRSAGNEFVADLSLVL